MAACRLVEIGFLALDVSSSGRVSAREIVATETPSSAATNLLEGEVDFFIVEARGRFIIERADVDSIAAGSLGCCKRLQSACYGDA